MAARRSGHTFSLCWLGPFPHDVATNEVFAGHEFEVTGTASYLASRTSHPAVAALGRRDTISPVAPGLGDFQNGRNPAHARDKGVFRALFGARFLFRNQRRLTSYGNVLFGGIRAGDDTAGNPIALPMDRRR